VPPGKFVHPDITTIAMMTTRRVRILWFIPVCHCAEI